MEACPQVSAHDLIMMCGLESQALGYHNLQKIGDSDPFRKKGGVRGAKKSRLKARVVDIRSNEEFCLGHVPNSKNIPESVAFQADGSLNPSLSLGAVPKGRVVVVVGGKKEKEPVVSTHMTCSLHRLSLLSANRRHYKRLGKRLNLFTCTYTYIHTYILFYGIVCFS